MKNNLLLILLLASLLTIGTPDSSAWWGGWGGWSGGGQGDDKDKDNDKDHDKDNDKDKDAHKLVIFGAEPDLADDDMLISGLNFSNNSTFNGIVTLYVPGTGIVELNDTSFTQAPLETPETDKLLVDIPDGLENSPGTFLLTVSKKNPPPPGFQRTKNGKRDHFHVAIGGGGSGIPGPEGPAGPTGADGPEGPEGPEGPQGDSGAQGEQGKLGTQGEQGKLGPQGPQGDTGVQGP